LPICEARLIQTEYRPYGQKHTLKNSLAPFAFDPNRPVALFLICAIDNVAIMWKTAILKWIAFLELVIIILDKQDNASELDCYRRPTRSTVIFAQGANITSSKGNCTNLKCTAVVCDTFLEKK